MTMPAVQSEQAKRYACSDSSMTRAGAWIMVPVTSGQRPGAPRALRRPKRRGSSSMSAVERSTSEAMIVSPRVNA